MPFIVRWPARIRQPAVSEALVCQIDFLASFAGLVGLQLNPLEHYDSENTLAAFLGESSTGRDILIEQAGRLAIRHRHWKYIPGGGGPKRNKTGNELGNDPAPQLFDLSRDLGERSNQAGSNSEMSGVLKTMLETVQARSN